MAGLLATSAGASAAPARANPHGKFLGVVGRHLAGALATPDLSSTGLAGTNNLIYNGGPVMHSDANYAIFWEPSGHSTPSTYKSLIGRYFSSVAADSGKTTNVYATDTEYYDTVGGTRNPIAYNATVGGSLVDTQPYPASGCPSQGGRPCLTDAQIAAEVERLIVANHTPRGLGSVYYVFFPVNVDSCFDSTTSTCSFNYYCAYHSSYTNGAGDVLYANMPYAAVPGCDPGQRPNGDPADATLNVLSHENNETITDPLGNAWYDAQGNENGDKCAWTFGSPLGGSSGSYFNQLINGGDFWLQQEWSNAVGGCLQREPSTDEAPTAAFTHSPSTPTAGSPVSFSGSGSSDPDGSITAYSWTFGDGATATGASPSHTYAAGGTYTVALQVTDSSGLTATTSQTVTVSSGADENPTASFTASRHGTGRLMYFAGSGSDPDGTIHSYAWSFGDGTRAGGQAVLHQFPQPGQYTVSLMVRDSSSLTAFSTQVVTAP